MSALTGLPNADVLSSCPQVLMSSSFVRCQGATEQKPFLLQWKAWTSGPRSWIQCDGSQPMVHLPEEGTYWNRVALVQERLWGSGQKSTTVLVCVCPTLQLPPLPVPGQEGDTQGNSGSDFGGMTGVHQVLLLVHLRLEPHFALPESCPQLWRAQAHLGLQTYHGCHSCFSRRTVVSGEDADSSAESKLGHLWNLCICLDASEQVSFTPHVLRGRSGAEGVTW